MTERLLRSDFIAMDSTIELQAFDGTLVEDVTDRLVVEGSWIARDSTGLEAGTASFVFDGVEGFDFGRHQLALTLTVHDLNGVEESVAFRAGNWLMRPPGTVLDHTQLTTIECVDTVSILSSIMGRSWRVDKGTNIGIAVANLLEAHGLNGLSLSLPDIALEMASAPSWALTEKLTWLEVGNEILRAAAHTGLFTDPNGTLTTLPWKPIDEVEPTWRFDASANDSWISAASQVEAETDPVPNSWLGVVTSPDSAVAGAQFPVENTDSLHPWSIPSQGGRRVVRVLEVDAPDLASLEATVLQTAEIDTLRAARVRLECGPLPIIWASDVVIVHAPKLDIIEKRGVCREWRIPLDVANSDAYYLIDVG